MKNQEISRNDNKTFLLDYLFAVNGIPIAGSGGAKIVSALANGMQSMGLKVGIIVFPREEWIKVLDENFRGYGRLSRFAQRLNDSPSMHRIMYPVLRRVSGGIPGCSFNPGVKIYNEKEMKKIRAKLYIATNFINAEFLMKNGIDAKKLVLFSQIDETQKLYSHGYADHAAELYKKLQNKIFINRDVANRFPPAEIVGMGIDLDRFTRSVSMDNRPTKSVVFILRRGEQKDPDTAIRTIDLLHRTVKGIRISAYGNLDRSMVPGYVQYYAGPNDRKMVSILNKNRIFVITSRLEGYPLPPLEAMACGCAVVSTDSVGVREYIKNGENGFIVPAGDEVSICKVVAGLLENTELLKKIAENGNLTAQENSYRRMIQNFIHACGNFDATERSDPPSPDYTEQQESGKSYIHK